MNSLLIDVGVPSVQLRQLELPDAQIYFEAVNANRQHLSQFGDITAEKYPNLASVEASLSNPENSSRLRLGIWDNAHFAGTINATYKPSGVEIGYWLDKRFTGRGLATMSVRALALYLRGEENRNIFARVAVGNTASSSVLERSNFFHSSTTPGEDPKWVFTYLDPLY